jgi:lysophospholipase L1-like esterase
MGNGFVDWFSRSYKALIVGLTAVMAIMLVVLAFQHVNASKPAAGAEPGPIPTFTRDADAAVTFAVVGDSVTAANSPNIDKSVAGDGSWAFYANRDGARLVGGWALGGATTEAMAQNVSAYKADVLVILAGTNDTGLAVPFETTAANLESIAKKAKVGTVIVSSIPPRDADTALPAAFNDQLKTLAQQQGWKYVDGAAALRDGNVYKDGFTADGIHPTADGAQALGSALHAAIVAAN